MKTSVLVVGGGLAGTSAAMFLAWRGVDVTLVEKHPSSSPHPRAVGFTARVGELLRAIDVYTGQPITRFALALSPHVFVRPGELRQAEWAEIDFDAAVWRIPAKRMKQRREHVVPLLAEALTGEPGSYEVLATAQRGAVTDHGSLLAPDAERGFGSSAR